MTLSSHTKLNMSLNHEKLFDSVMQIWCKEYFQFVLDLDLFWDWWALSGNPNITWDIVQEYPSLPWKWETLSSNPNITWDIVQKNRHCNWDYKYLSRNPNITWKMIQQNPKKNWDWEAISENSRITTCKRVEEHPEYPWVWRGLCRNPNINPHILSKHLITWDTVHITTILQDIKQHPEKTLDWENISRNPEITWEVVQQYPDKPWDWYELSFHIDAPLEIIVQKLPPHHTNWIMNPISHNKRTALREKYLQTNLAKKGAELFIKSDLKRELMEKLWHPCNMMKWSGWGFEVEE
jgi:hypothetical protein